MALMTDPPVAAAKAEATLKKQMKDLEKQMAKLKQQQASKGTRSTEDSEDEDDTMGIESEDDIADDEGNVLNGGLRASVSCYTLCY